MDELKITRKTEPVMFTIRVDKSIVDFYRQKRAQFNSGAMLAGKVKPITGKAAETAKAIASNDIDI